MTMTMTMAGKPGRSGRKSTPDDKQLIRDLGEAHRNVPQRKVIASWKSAVRKAVAAKKRQR
jgi:hypothetical protein